MKQYTILYTYEDSETSWSIFGSLSEAKKYMKKAENSVYKIVSAELIENIPIDFWTCPHYEITDCDT